jgi:hypothetical protein
MMAWQYHVNWRTVFPSREIEDYDVIINYLKISPYGSNGGVEGHYAFVEHCSDSKTAYKIISTCRKMVKNQYDRMMMIRVAKKYSLSDQILTKIQLEYHNSENYEISVADLFEEVRNS